MHAVTHGLQAESVAARKTELAKMANTAAESRAHADALRWQHERESLEQAHAEEVSAGCESRVVRVGMRAGCGVPGRCHSCRCGPPA